MTDEERTKYLKLVGGKGLKMLGIIESLRPVIDKMEIEPYKEILTKDIETHKDLWNKIYNDLVTEGKADTMDILKLQIRHEHIKKLAEDVFNYETAVDHVKTTVHNGTDK